MNESAAEHNWNYLKACNFDVAEAIRRQADSPVAYGSEFRPAAQLQPLLFRHPRWDQFNQRLNLGCLFHLDDIDEESRRRDFADSLARGNHKSAAKRPQVLRDLIADDVTHGFQLPLPRDKVAELDGTAFAPYGIADQMTINELGDIVPKDRLTHDQSWAYSEGNSVNDRVRVDRYIVICPYNSIYLREHWLERDPSNDGPPRPSIDHSFLN